MSRLLSSLLQVGRQIPALRTALPLASLRSYAVKSNVFPIFSDALIGQPTGTRIYDSPFIVSGPTSEQITKGIQVHSVPGVLVLNLIDDIPSSSSSDSLFQSTVTESGDEIITIDLSGISDQMQNRSEGLQLSNVLKKRRRKMNHHKYKKLRKRMRAHRRKLE